MYTRVWNYILKSQNNCNCFFEKETMLMILYQIYKYHTKNIVKYKHGPHVGQYNIYMTYDLGQKIEEI